MSIKRLVPRDDRPRRPLTREENARLGIEVCTECDRPAVMHYWGIVDCDWVCINCLRDNHPVEYAVVMERDD